MRVLVAEDNPDMSAFLSRALKEEGFAVDTMIYENVWNDAFDGISNTLEVHIREIRRHLEDAGAPQLIHTLRGRGYILALDSDR